MKTPIKQRGLTLIETLVALAIMGLVTVSILVLVGQNTRFTFASQERSYAAIAADNLMVEVLAGVGPIETGEELGDVVLAGRQWRYRQTVTQTGAPNIFRIDIEILSQTEDQIIASATTLRKGEQ